jgi:hypothetical protein
MPPCNIEDSVIVRTPAMHIRPAISSLKRVSGSHESLFVCDREQMSPLLKLRKAYTVRRQYFARLAGTNLMDVLNWTAKILWGGVFSDTAAKLLDTHLHQLPRVHLATMLPWTWTYI